MTWLTAILKELERPDDQGRDWYGWATNQMSHGLLGVAGVAVIMGVVLPFVALGIVLALAATKEGYDLAKGGRFKDSAQDFAFQSLGGVLALALMTQDQVAAWAAVGVFTLGLLGGVIPRARRALIQTPL